MGAARCLVRPLVAAVPALVRDSKAPSTSSCRASVPEGGQPQQTRRRAARRPEPQGGERRSETPSEARVVGRACSRLADTFKSRRHRWCRWNQGRWGEARRAGRCR